MKTHIVYQVLLAASIIFSCGSALIAQIPTISIQSNEEIVDEPKVPATFIYTGVNGEIISSSIGIEIRGGFSQTYPKKTYDIEFWNDATGTETLDVQFGDLREDDDWVLDAMYNEPLRINSYIAHKLWLDMNQLHYANQEPNAKSGADVMYVEVSINNVYQGIYLLSEQIDRFQLKLKKPSNNLLRGELYKGYAWDDAVLFNNPDESPNNNSLTWSGYEYRFPKDLVDWSNVSELIAFVANSTDDAFSADIANRFDLNNLMDYFILLNLARILDNRGKNIYLCRYDADDPYFFAPWDLDGSWGLLWNGNNDTTTEGILSNNLYDRLISNDVDDFRQKLADRWHEMRSTLISDDALEDKILTANQFLKDNDIYDKEGGAWDYEYSDSKLNYIFNWLEDRLEYLDEYFDNITNVDYTQNESTLKVYPNPAQDFILISGEFNKNKVVTIYNVLGEVKSRYTRLNLESRINIEPFNSGLYIVEIGSFKSMFYKL